MKSKIIFFKNPSLTKSLVLLTLIVIIIVTALFFSILIILLLPLIFVCLFILKLILKNKIDKLKNNARDFGDNSSKEYIDAEYTHIKEKADKQ